MAVRDGEPPWVNITERLQRQVSDEQDDVLASLHLVQGDHDLEDRLFARLVDLLVEGLFLDLRQQHAAGDLDGRALTREMADLARACHHAGLLPLPARRI
jgi:hypothetical protein